MFSDRVASFQNRRRESFPTQSRTSRNRSFQSDGVESMQARRRSTFRNRCKHAHNKTNKRDKRKSQFKNSSDANKFISSIAHMLGAVHDPQHLSSFHAIVMSPSLTQKTACRVVESGVVRSFLHYLQSPQHPTTPQKLEDAAEPARKVLEIVSKLCGCNDTLLKILCKLGTVTSVINCMSWCPDDAVICLCLKTLAKVCISEQLAQIMIEKRVIEFVAQGCGFTNFSIVSTGLETIRSFVKVLGGSQWQRLATVPEFVARVLQFCKLCKYQAHAAQGAQGAQGVQGVQATQAARPDAMELDENEPETQPELIFDGTPEELAHLEQDAVWLLYEVAEKGHEQLLLQLARIRMPTEADEQHNKKQEQPQHQQASQTLLDYLHQIVRQECAKCHAKMNWDEERCSPILALWSAFVASRHDEIRRLILVSDSLELLQWFVLQTNRMHGVLLKMMCNIVMQNGGTGTNDTQSINNALEWAAMRNGGIGGRDKKCYDRRREACRFVLIYVMFVVRDVKNFVLDPRVLKLTQNYLESKSEFDVWWGLTALLESLKRIEKEENNNLKRVLNELEKEGIVKNVNDVAVRVTDGNFGDSVLNMIDELSEKYFDGLGDFSTDLCIF